MKKRFYEFDMNEALGLAYFILICEGLVEFRSHSRWLHNGLDLQLICVLSSLMIAT